jgi:NAD(P) transhydrogenase subunit beta
VISIGIVRDSGGGAATLEHVLDLAAAVLIILGLKGLSSPTTAKRGNLLAGLGLGLAVLTTFVGGIPQNLGWIVTGLALGSGLGAWGARAVLMTDMPQMVALLNGLGGGAAALVSAAEFAGRSADGLATRDLSASSISIVVGTLIGAISFAGSLVAFGKLQGLITERAVSMPFGRAIPTLVLVATVALGVASAMGGSPLAFAVFAALSLLLGVVMVLPIGGADMPVVISILNSCTGLAAAATGFVLNNAALLIAGTLVGASGTLLTQLMCKAMNRSLGNVLFGGVGGAPVVAPGGAGGAAPKRNVRDLSPEDAAVLLANVSSLIIVPGYGMAVAQAQHVTRELADLLTARGVDVKYAIHPVAGRMPGHMNVLLAEANVPYNQLYDLEAINADFEHTDVALVVGANDVVNPAARHDRTSPIFGMPILDADKARHILLVKRSLNAGFAGIDNELYYDPKTTFVFGDARQVLSKIVEALKHEA